jgi:hypothetical protein
MSDHVLTQRGRIKKRLGSTVYLDSSVLVDYFSVESVEAYESPDEMEGGGVWNTPAHDVVRELLKADVRLRAMAQLRHRYLRCKETNAILTHRVASVAKPPFLRWVSTNGVLHAFVITLTASLAIL